MHRRYIRGMAVALLIGSLPLVGGCESAPATGRSFFTGGMTPEKEARIGQQENEKVLKQFAGAALARLKKAISDLNAVLRDVGA